SLVLMPELALSGYGFRDRIGTDWIPRTQANSMRWASALAAANGLAVIFTAPEYDEEHGRLYNSIMAFASGGNHLATHRKIAVLKLGSESWSSPGTGPTAVALDGIGRLGLFVCADMALPRLVEETCRLGPDLLISSANWAPGDHGPSG